MSKHICLQSIVHVWGEWGNLACYPARETQQRGRRLDSICLQNVTRCISPRSFSRSRQMEILITKRRYRFFFKHNMMTMKFNQARDDPWRGTASGRYKPASTMHRQWATTITRGAEAARAQGFISIEHRVCAIVVRVIGHRAVTASFVRVYLLMYVHCASMYCISGSFMRLFEIWHDSQLINYLRGKELFQLREADKLSL